VATPVAVDDAVAGAAVTVGEDDAALEHVAVVAGVVACGVGQGHAEQGAKFGDEELVVGAFAAAAALPAGEEGA
jgi:hypothetical protein